MFLTLEICAGVILFATCEVIHRTLYPNAPTRGGVSAGKPRCTRAAFRLRAGYIETIKLLVGGNQVIKRVCAYARTRASPAPSERGLRDFLNLNIAPITKSRVAAVQQFHHANSIVQFNNDTHILVLLGRLI